MAARYPHLDLSATPNEPLVLEVERFEHVSDGAERILLRLDGRYTDRPGKRVLDAMLFVDDGLAIHRHATLPDPDGALDSWVWRAAFDVPASYLTDARTRFAIEAEPGTLLDLPRPGDLPASATLPISVRAAHIARRYAAAVAVLLTVAVAPGGLPASARTEVLKVRQPNGAIVYMSTDGQVLSQIPPDAVVIDRTDSQPAQAPAQPDQTTQTDTQQQQSTQPESMAPSTTIGATGGSVTKTHHIANHSRPQHKAKQASAAHTGHRHHQQPQHTQQQQQTPDPQQPSQPRHQHQHQHRHHHHAAPPAQHPNTPTPQNPEPASAQEPVTTHEQLTPMPGLAPKFQPLARISGHSHPHHAHSTPAVQMPSKGLESLANLGVTGATAPDPATAPANPPANPPQLFTPPPQQTGQPTPPAAHHGRSQHHTSSHHAAPHPHRAPQHHAAPSPRHTAHVTPVVHHSAPHPNVGAPTLAPSPFSLKSPTRVTGVPNFVIDQFRVPPFLLPIYQAAGLQYGVRWEVLAAINEIETDYGRNLSVSSAGALGWMQFMPQTWQMYGVDANRDHRKDPYNPVDAIFAAARYLKAAGGDKNVRQAIYAYNHATWYVDSVMLRAKLLAGYPPEFVNSLTGLTEGRFPVAAKAQYGDAGAKADLKRVKPGQNAANVVSGDGQHTSIDVFSHTGAPVVAVNDGVVKAIGHSKTKGNFIVIQDVYGNQFTYSHLGSVAKVYPVPKPLPPAPKKAGKKGGKKGAGHDPKPSAPATAGAQRPEGEGGGKKAASAKAPAKPQPAPAPAPASQTPVAVKQRLFAHPERPNAAVAGGFEQTLASQSGKFETYDGYFSRSLGLNSKNATLKKLKKGSQVIGGTVLGRIGQPKQGKPHLKFEIRPAGKGAPKIDPKPILDGWKLLGSTAIYRASGRNVLDKGANFTIGEAMLLPKAMLEQRVLSDPRIHIYPGGRNDVKTGQIDRRVLIVLEYLADSGLNPTVSCLKSGHSLLTSSGNVSEHVSGDAVDISAINGTPILGHQGAGSIAETTVKKLMQLQGAMAPHQIISLMDFGANTLALPDHYNHIHVGFHPLFGDNSKLGQQTLSVLKPKQWGELVQHLGEIQNPAVPTHPSKYAIPDNPAPHR